MRFWIIANIEEVQNKLNFLINLFRKENFLFSEVEV